MVRRPAHRQAFTLLEMTVALALIAILALALYMSLHIGFDARKRAGEAIAPARATTVALELVRRDVESALPPTGVLAGAFVGQDGADSSGGGGDDLSFYADVQGAAGDQSRIRRIEFVVVPSGDGGDSVLVRRVTSNLLAPTTPEPVEETLCRNVMSFNLRYFDGSAWLDSWDSTTQDNALPLAVEADLRLRVSTSEDDEAGGYELVRVFLLPCSKLASGEGTNVVLPSL